VIWRKTDQNFYWEKTSIIFFFFEISSSENNFFINLSGLFFQGLCRYLWKIWVSFEIFIQRENLTRESNPWDKKSIFFQNWRYFFFGKSTLNFKIWTGFFVLYKNASRLKKENVTSRPFFVFLTNFQTLLNKDKKKNRNELFQEEKKC